MVLSIVIIVIVFTKISINKPQAKIETTTGPVKTTEIIKEEISEPEPEVEEVITTSTPTTSYVKAPEEEKRYVEDVSETKQEIVTEVKSEYSSASEEEIIMLAKLVYAEAGGIPSDTEQSCVIWTVLNRVDSSIYPNTIAACITQPSQFAYRSSTKVTDHCLWLARDVVSRWERERAGETNVGRTLPPGYFSFWGDGRHNYFRVGCGDQVYWDYSYGTPYAS